MKRFGKAKGTIAGRPDRGPREEAKAALRLNVRPPDLIVTARKWRPLTGANRRGRFGAMENVELQTEDAILSHGPVECLTFDNGH